MDVTKSPTKPADQPLPYVTAVGPVQAEDWGKLPWQPCTSAGFDNAEGREDLGKLPWQLHVLLDDHKASLETLMKRQRWLASAELTEQCAALRRQVQKLGELFCQRITDVQDPPAAGVGPEATRPQQAAGERGAERAQDMTLQSLRNQFAEMEEERVLKLEEGAHTKQMMLLEEVLRIVKQGEARCERPSRTDKAPCAPAHRKASNCPPEGEKVSGVVPVRSVQPAQSEHGVMTNSSQGTPVPRPAFETPAQRRSKFDASYDITALQAVQGWTHKLGRSGSGTKRSNYAASMVMARGRRNCMEAVSGALVLLNMLYMAVEVEVSMRYARRGERTPGWLWWGGLAFAVVFTVELGVKLLVEGRHFFVGPQRRWNVMDVTLVVFQVLDLAFSFMNLGFVRGLRAVRAARIIRAMRYIRELRLMVASIACSLASLMWALVLLLLVLFVCSMGVQQTVQAELEQHGYERLHPKLLHYYGSLPGSMFSLFMAISGGIDWKELVEPLEDISKVYVVCFVFFVSFVLLGLLNILTAIFVESTCKIAEVDADLVIQENLDNENSAINRLREILLTADVSGSGFVSKEEFETKLADPRFKAQLRLLDLDMLEARGLFQLLDVEQLGFVSVEELVYSLMRLKGAARAMDMATMLYENKRIFAKLSSFMTFADENFQELRAALRIATASLGATDGQAGLTAQGQRAADFAARERIGGR